MINANSSRSNLKTSPPIKNCISLLLLDLTFLSKNWWISCIENLRSRARMNYLKGQVVALWLRLSALNLVLILGITTVALHDALPGYCSSIARIKEDIYNKTTKCNYKIKLFYSQIIWHNSMHFDAYFDGCRFNSIHKSMVFYVYSIDIRYIAELKFSFWFWFRLIVTQCYFNKSSHFMKNHRNCIKKKKKHRIALIYITLFHFVLHRIYIENISNTINT